MIGFIWFDMITVHLAHWPFNLFVMIAKGHLNLAHWPPSVVYLF